MIRGGENTRAFCYVYVDDFVAGLFAATVSGSADGEEISIVELAHRMINIARVKPRIEVTEAPFGSAMRRCPDIALAKRLLGYQPNISLEQGMARTFEWCKSRLALYIGRSVTVRIPDANLALTDPVTVADIERNGRLIYVLRVPLIEVAPKSYA